MFTCKLLVLAVIACAANLKLVHTSADEDTLMQSDFLDDLAVEKSSSHLQDTRSAETLTEIMQEDRIAEVADDMSDVATVLLQSWANDTGLTASAQANKLSLVVRYAGTGYDLLKGSPEGDFNSGGIDPGIKKTREIFAQSFEYGKEAFYRGRSMKVPDQVSFHASESCAKKNSVKAYSGRKSYMNELKTSVSISGGFIGLFSFSLSHAMHKVEAMTRKQQRIIIQKNMICNYGTARYLYENAIAGEKGYTLSKSFRNYVKYLLPSTYSERAYMRFIQMWGTHIIMMVDVGTRKIERSSATYSKVYNYLRKKHAVRGSTGGFFKGFFASGKFSVKKLNENINENTNLGQKMTAFTIGTRDVPLPIHLDLLSISRAFESHWWGGDLQWRRDKMDKKWKNLKKALKDYPAYMHARKNEDPYIRLKITWPQGKYALPATTKGCPSGWSEGWRLQTTGKKNRHTNGIRRAMRIDFWKKRARTYYCVKTKYGSGDFEWSEGTYCIAKYGICPDKFQSGYLYWRDRKGKKNKVWGVLPEGSYNKNTKINYCCRSDGRHSRPILLPTDHPFILYRYGGTCQQVQGMRYTQYYVKWDDKKHKRKCGGSHPDASCGKHQTLYYCYYHKK